MSSRSWMLAGLMGLVASVVSAGPASAGAPTEQLRSRIDRAIRVLEDADLKQESRQADRRAAVWTIANETFDFREIAQRSLARHWQSRTPAERDEFVPLFADLLERSYISQIEQYSGSEKIQYVGETTGGGLALVRTKLVTRQGTEVPVDYRMHRTGDRWLVYDVSIEGISLVSNYRAQFDRIIRSSSYRTLADKLRAKKDEAREADAGVTRASSSK